MNEELSVNHLTDQQEIERRLNHPAAHRARMAHRVIRLREVGFDDTSGKLLKLADDAPKSTGGPLKIGGVEGLARLLNATADGIDGDRPGPSLTEKFTSRLFQADRSTLFSIWQSEADEASADFDPAGHKEALESRAKDREAAEETAAKAGVEVADYVPHGMDGEWAANALYDLGREGFLLAEIDWDTAVIKVDLVDSGAYTINLATDKFRSSIAVGARIASSAALASKTGTLGVADAADITYTALTGTSIELIVIYQSSAVGGGADVADTAQRLIAAIDTATGLPFTPSGGDVTVTWDNTTNRIFKL